MFVLVYDEWGGFFDHRRTATFADERSSSVNDEDFGQGGFRVPAIIASPYVAPGSVEPALFDHTSIMRFLEWRFLGSPAAGPNGHGHGWWLTERDRNATNIGRVIGLEKPNPDLGFDIDLPLKFFLADCEGPTIPGAALGGPGDSPLSDKLEALTAARFPDAQARPWIENVPGVPALPSS